MSTRATSTTFMASMARRTSAVPTVAGPAVTPVSTVAPFPAMLLRDCAKVLFNVRLDNTGRLSAEEQGEMQDLEDRIAAVLKFAGEGSR